MNTPLTLFTGNDYDAVRLAYEKFRAGLSYQPDIVVLSPVDTSADVACEHLLSQDLFGNEKLIVLDGLLSEPVVRDALAQTHHRVVALEEKLSADIKKFLKKYPETIIHENKTPAKKDNAIFGLTNHFRARDPKNMWLAYRQLLSQGHTVHQMVGVLWWQIKSMLLVQKDPQNHGLKPFVLGQAQKSLGNYPQDSLAGKATELLDLYHRGHEDGSLEGRFEEWVLGLRRNG